MQTSTKIILSSFLFCLTAGATAYAVRQVSLEQGMFSTTGNQAVSQPIAADIGIKQTTVNSVSATPLSIEQIGQVTSTEPEPSVFCLKSKDKVTELCLKNVTAVNTDDPVFVKGMLMAYGTTTAFENTAQWNIADENKKVIAKGTLQVQSPDIGVPGAFSFSFPLKPSTSNARTATVTVYEASAKDGTPIHVVKIPFSY